MSGYLDPEAVASLCEGIKPTHKGYMAKCPAHEDKSPSLAIDQGYRGTLIYCHRGCTLDEICKALEINRAQLFIDYTDTNPRTLDARTKLRELTRRISPPTLRTQHHTLEDVIRATVDATPERWAVTGVRWQDYLRLPFQTAMKKDWVVIDGLIADLIEDKLNDGFDYSQAAKRRLTDKMWKEYLTNGDRR